MRRRIYIIIGVLLFGGANSYAQALAPLAPDAWSARSVDWLSPVSLLTGRPYSFNWSEFPLKLSAGESYGYNDNILGLAPKQPAPAGTLRGDSYFTTSVGASTKAYWAAQIFYADANYSLVNYIHDTNRDASHYSFDGGVDWAVTSRCSGTLAASSVMSQTPIEQQLTPGIDNTLVNTITETGLCKGLNNYGVVLNSGLSTSTFSQTLSKLNNADAKHIQGGAEYLLNDLNTLKFLTQLTETHYPNRAKVLPNGSLGLLTDVQQLDLQLFYSRTFSDKFNFNLMGGLSRPTGANATIGSQGATQNVPVYNVVINYLPSAKWLLTLSSNRTVGAPVSVLANSQTTMQQTLSATYFWTSKFSLQATVGMSTFSGSNTAVQKLVGAATAASNNDSYTGSLLANYHLTPFTSVTASYQYSSRGSLGSIVTSNIAMLGLNFKPY